MKRMRIIGLCFVAVLALGAVAAADASAELPALYQCSKAVPKNTGHYTNKECTEAGKVESGGKYELKEGIGKGKGFKGGGGTAFLEIVGLGPITCTKGTTSGHFTSPKTAGGIHATFTGCELLKVTCTNTGKTGEIATKTLKGELGYVSKEKVEVGIDLTPEEGEFEAEGIKCSTLTVRVHGSVIGLVNPVNKFSKTSTVKFTESGGKQGIQKFEGQPKDTLVSETLVKEIPPEWSAEAESGQSGEASLKGEFLELKA